MAQTFGGLTLFLLVFVGLQHVAFFVLEAFLWEKPVGRKIFRTTAETARATAALAANQGVYNAFLAAGCVWAVAVGVGSGLGYAEFARSLAGFFFGCVLVAGVVGAATVNKRIFFIQGVPALLGLLSLVM